MNDRLSSNCVLGRGMFPLRVLIGKFSRKNNPEDATQLCQGETKQPWPVSYLMAPCANRPRVSNTPTVSSLSDGFGAEVQRLEQEVSCRVISHPRLIRGEVEVEGTIGRMEGGGKVTLRYLQAQKPRERSDNRTTLEASLVDVVIKMFNCVLTEYLHSC